MWLATCGLLFLTLPDAAPAATLPAVESPTASILVIPVEAKLGVSRDLGDVLTSLVAAEAARYPQYRVVTYREIEGTLQQEQLRQVAACDSVSCAADIAGALNADQILLGSVSKAGDTYVLVLTRVKSRSAIAAGRAVAQVRGSKDDALFAMLPQLVATVLGVAPLDAQAPKATAPPRAEKDTPLPVTPAIAVGDADKPRVAEVAGTRSTHRVPAFAGAGAAIAVAVVAGLGGVALSLLSAALLVVPTRIGVKTYFLHLSISQKQVFFPALATTLATGAALLGVLALATLGGGTAGIVVGAVAP